MGKNYDRKVNKSGGVILLNNDNVKERNMVEHCPTRAKVMVNPILDWKEEDVWEFLNSNNIPHCCLYDEGFTRLGCIGCPLSGRKNMERDFERWPKYKELYIRAFQRMIDNHHGQIKILEKINGGGAVSSELGRMGRWTASLPLTSAQNQSGGVQRIYFRTTAEAMAWYLKN